ncbi:hypothetical protein BKA62DRAFT_488386 [Auriculariales sp. MPI-PUGE-AT-0066]|nr:hypothetical protein BKA62DRAFT_488386 [Auriculariales sp. MPI-PUGE-AT-0066]
MVQREISESVNSTWMPPPVSFEGPSQAVPVAEGEKLDQKYNNNFGWHGRFSAQKRSPLRDDLPWETPEEESYPFPDQSKYSDYEKRYPPDRYGEELHPNSRVFRVYRDRVTEKDEDLVQGWQDTLNVLLVFAGLFSTVLTAFLVESSKQLRTDNSDMTTKAVLAILARLEGENITTSVGAIRAFTPSPNDRSINGLWICSLALSLIVSLLAILVKQWLVEYISLMRSSAGNPEQWALRHYALRRGLTRWRIEAFISWLAILLHGSLFLFLGGFCAFIYDLDMAIFGVVAAMTAMTGSFYVVSTIAPLYWADCPTRTPFMHQVNRMFQPVGIAISSILRHLNVAYWNFLNYLSVVAWSILDSIRQRDFDWVFCNIRKDLSQYHHPRVVESIYSQSLSLTGRLVRENQHNLMVDVLMWLLNPDNQLENSDAGVALDAIGSIDVVEHQRRYTYSPDPFTSSHVGAALERRFILLTQAIAPTYDAMRSSEISRTLRTWIVTRRPVSMEMANHLEYCLSLKTHNIGWLAQSLISLRGLGLDPTGLPEFRTHPKFAALLTNSWTLANWSLRGLLAEDIRATHYAYREALRDVEWVPGFWTLNHLEASLLPFETSIDFVQSCTTADIDSACSLVGNTLVTADLLSYLSPRLGNILFCLLLQRASLNGTGNFMRQWQLTHAGRSLECHHKHFLEKLKSSGTVEVFVHQTMVNVLCRRQVTESEATSTWKLYLSMRSDVHLNDEVGGVKDADAAQMFAIELALLSRLGLESGHARALVQELVGDDRGVQLLLANTADFESIAIHAKVVEPSWWVGMRQRILDLSRPRWDSRRRNYVGRHSTRQEIVDAIENALPCGMCAETEHELRHIFTGDPSPIPSVSPTAYSDRVTGSLGKIQEAPMNSENFPYPPQNLVELDCALQPAGSEATTAKNCTPQPAVHESVISTSVSIPPFARLSSSSLRRAFD